MYKYRILNKKGFFLGLLETKKDVYPNPTSEFKIWTFLADVNVEINLSDSNDQINVDPEIKTVSFIPQITKQGLVLYVVKGEDNLEDLENFKSKRNCNYRFLANGEIQIN